MSEQYPFGEIDYEDAVAGDRLPDISLELLRSELAPPEETEKFLYRTRPELPTKEIRPSIEQLLQEASYRPEHGRWVFAKAVGNFVVRKGERLVGYDETLKGAEARSGEAEAATFGRAVFGDRECAVFAMNWDFLGGSVGEVVGEKFIAAAKLARREKLPFVAVYASGGMRQHENAFALAQMPRCLAALEEYKKESKEPHIAVLYGQVWGGTSASTVPLADTIVGVGGSDFGFAGPRVIENYQNQPVDPSSQSVEANYLNRFVHAVVQKEYLKEYLDEYVRIAGERPRSGVPETVQREIWELRHPSTETYKLSLGADGLAPPLQRQFAYDVSAVEFSPARAKMVDSAVDQKGALLENYQHLAADVGRADGHYLIHTVFDEAVPLYNQINRGDTVEFPKIIGAIARLKDQEFMVIADQPSYRLQHGGIRKILPFPAPQDYEYVTHLQQVAERRGLPIVTFTDTLGAEPTIKAEQRGQSRAIAHAMRALQGHPRPVLSIVTGALGSGGGLGTTQIGPNLMAHDDAMIFVADPTAATSIVYRTPNPTPDQIADTLEGMDASAKVLQGLGYISTLIKQEPEQVATARNIREAIIAKYDELSGLSDRRMRKMVLKGLWKLKRGNITYK